MSDTTQGKGAATGGQGERESVEQRASREAAAQQPAQPEQAPARARTEPEAAKEPESVDGGLPLDQVAEQHAADDETNARHLAPDQEG